MQMREGTAPPGPEKFDALLRGMDKIRQMIENISFCESIDIEEELKAFEAIQTGKGTGSPSDKRSAPDQKTAPVLYTPVYDPPPPVVEDGTDTGVLSGPDPDKPVRPGPIVSRQVSGCEEMESDGEAKVALGSESTTETKIFGLKGGSHETVRVSVDLIDRMMNLAGELVLGRNQLRRLLEDQIEHKNGLGAVMQSVDLVTSDMQEQIMQLRMQPVGNVFSRFPRLVRDLSRQLSKEVELVVEGAEVEMDKSILEALTDPLIHLVRNSIDHGLESGRERKSSGKSEKGRITLKAFHEEGQVNITVSDDGRGMNPDDILEKAISIGMLDVGTGSQMSDAEKIQLIFLPGFSMAHTITDVSGRGVGMDVVRTNIENIGGRLNVSSTLGKGTTVQLRLPLTLAIIPSLVVRAGGQTFAIPQMDVQELVCIQIHDITEKIEKIGNASVLRLRGRLMPVLRLADVLNLDRKFLHPVTGRETIDRRARIADRRKEGELKPVPEMTPSDQDLTDAERRNRPSDRRYHRSGDFYVVVLKVGPNRYGLLVDELLNTEEIVVKPLSNHIKDCRWFSGTTIMGDGRVAMILNAGGIADVSRLRFGDVGAEENRRKEEDEKRQAIEQKPHISTIIFNNAWQEYFALPLKQVARLEKIDPLDIKRIGVREFIKYRGGGLPLIHLEDFLPVGPIPENIEEIFLILPKTEGASAGIVASRILDIVDIEEDVVSERKKRLGIKGSTIIEGNLTMILEAEELLEAASRDQAHDRCNSEPLTDA